MHQKCIFRVVQNELQFYFATGPDTVLILNCYFTSYILIAVIIATFSECKGFACKIKAQRKACKGHFKVREQSRPCASQTGRKKMSTGADREHNNSRQIRIQHFNMDQSEFIILT